MPSSLKQSHNTKHIKGYNLKIWKEDVKNHPNHGTHGTLNYIKQFQLTYILHEQL